MSKLANKVALVTGGSRGIGAAIAKRLAADGASVAITYAKDANAASAVVKAIEAGGRKALAIQADAADPKAINAAIEKTVATLGRLDVLVNNAGTAITKPFEQTTLEEMDQMINLNFRGVLVATQAALKHLNDNGRIIMIGSCVGERMMTPGLAAYSATKGAVKMFTQGLSREVGGRGITVNNIQPGPIDTDLNPAAGDWAKPRSKSARVVSSTFIGMTVPALFTSTSSRSNVVTVFSTAFLTASASAASALIAIAFPPPRSISLTMDAAASVPLE